MIAMQLEHETFAERAEGKRTAHDKDDAGMQGRVINCAKSVLKLNRECSGSQIITYFCVHKYFPC